jgi:hypothetical protein
VKRACFNAGKVRASVKRQNRNRITSSKTTPTEIFDVLRDRYFGRTPKIPFDRNASEIQKEMSIDFEPAIPIRNRNPRQIRADEGRRIQVPKCGWKAD